MYVCMYLPVNMTARIHVNNRCFIQDLLVSRWLPPTVVCLSKVHMLRCQDTGAISNGGVGSFAARGLQIEDCPPMKWIADR